METANWKRVLIAWINASNISKQHAHNIEQTNILKFYKKLREKLNYINTENIELMDFLKEQYPNFEFHTDDENKLSTSDYMYVYSLLLHFACVKCSNEYFQKICENLDEIFQEAIASFFTRLLAIKNLDKTGLRRVIESAAPKTLPAQADSPPKIQKFRISPPTPKSHMLDERTKELHSIKAQLETEKYDKTCLEMALKQNEETNRKLGKDQEKLIVEINELKRQLAESSESTEKKHSDEQSKNELKKKIIQKENEVCSLKESMDVLIEETRLLEAKQIQADNEIKDYMNKFMILEKQLMELQNEMEKKDACIVELTANKIELEKHINELCSPSYRGSGSGDIFNSSVECLDNSFLRNLNNSDSSEIPENLGCSVIDIQLREKENENQKLREENEKFKFDNKNLANHFHSILKNNMNIFEFCENFKENNDSDLDNILITFDMCIQQLIQKYCDTNNTIREVKNKNQYLKQEIIDVTTQINSLNNQILEYDEKFIEIGKEKQLVEEENKKFKKNLEKFTKDLSQLSEENRQLNAELLQLKENHNGLISDNKKSNKEFLAKLNNLSDDLATKCKHIANLDAINEKLSLEINDLKSNVLNMHEVATDLDSAKRKLEKEKLSLDNQIDELKKTLLKCKEIEDQFLNENDALQNTQTIHLKLIEELKLNYNMMRSNFESKEADLKEQSQRNVNLMSELNSILETNSVLKKERDCLEKNVKSLKICENNLEKEKSNLVLQLNELEMKLTESLDKEKSFAVLKDDFNKKHLEQLETINKLTENIFKIEMTTELLRNEKDELAQNNDQLNIDIKNYKSMMKEHENLKTDYHKKTNECDEMNAKVKTLELDISKLKIELENSQESLNNTNKKNSKMTKTIEDLTDSKNDLNANFNKVNSENKNLMNTLNTLKDKNAELDEKIVRLISEIEELINEKRKCNTINTNLKKNYKETEKKISTLAKNIEELKEKNSNLQSNVDDLLNVVDTLTNEKSQVCKDLEEMILLKSEYDKNINKMISEIENCDCSCLSELKSPLDELEHKLRCLKKSNDTIMKVNDELKKDISYLTDEIRKQSKGTEALSYVIQKTVNDYEDCKIKCSDAIKSNKKLELQLDAVLDEKLKGIEANQVLEHKLCRMTNDTTSLLSDFEFKMKTLKTDYVNEKEALTEQLKILQDIVDLNTEKLANKEIECEGLHQELKSTNREKVAVKQDLDRTKKSLNDFKGLNEKHQSLVKLKDSLETENEELKIKMQSIEERLENEIKQLNEEILFFKDAKSKLSDENMELNQKNQAQSEIINEKTRLFDEQCKENNVLQSESSELKGKCEQIEKMLADKTAEYHSINTKYSNLCLEFNKISDCLLRSEENIVEINKRLEKNSIRLGESQAQALKFEKENDTLQKTVDLNKVTIENLQKENSKMQADFKTLKTKHSKTKIDNESSISKISKLEERNNALKAELDKVISEELSARENLCKLKKQNKEDIERIKKLSTIASDFNRIKQDNEFLDKKNVQLKLEIGCLNQSIKELNKHKTEMEKKIEFYVGRIDQMSQENCKLLNENVNLQSFATKISAENSKLNDEISKVSLQSQLLESNFDIECKQLKYNCNQLMNEKETLEKNVAVTTTLIEKLLMTEKELKEQIKNDDDSSTMKLKQIQDILDQKNVLIEKLQEENSQIKSIDQCVLDKMHKKNDEFEKLEKDLKEEKEINEKLRRDISIFQAKLTKHRSISDENEKKWLEERNSLIANNKTVDQRIKENRLELEGKLEKMKAKMRRQKKHAVVQTDSNNNEDLNDNTKHELDQSMETKIKNWKSKKWIKICREFLKYPLTIAFTIIILGILFNHYLKVNDLKVIVSSITPTVY